MGNSSAKNNPGQYGRRPHSVLGVQSDDRYSLTDPDILLERYHHDQHYHHHHHQHHQHQSHQHNNHRQSSQAHEKGARVSGKAILPPLPRSHSFHQILRPTENGVNLIQKGTIRGIDHRSYSKDIQLTPEDILNPELNAILRERRCKSEADLIENDGDDGEDEMGQLGEDKASSDKSTERSAEGIRKGLTNGVAARIQRAKYKAPAPPVPLDQSESSPVRHEIIESKMLIDSNMRESKRSLQSKEKSENKSKLGLIRRLSDKSHLSNRTSENDEVSARENFMMLSKAKATGAPLSPRLIESKLRDTNGINGLLNNDGVKFNRLLQPNAIDERESYVYNQPNEASLNEINDFIARELALRSINGVAGQHNHINGDDGESRYSGGGGGGGSGRRGMSKIFRKDQNGVKSNLGNNHSNGSPVNQITSSNDHHDKNGKSGCYLPPVFDDNFILKRTTPTAGLTQNGARSSLGINSNSKKMLDLYPSKLNQESERNRYNLESKMSPIINSIGLTGLLSGKQQQHQQNQVNRHDVVDGYRYDDLVNPDSMMMIKPGSPLLPSIKRQQSAQSPNHQSRQWNLNNYLRGHLNNNHNNQLNHFNQLSSPSPPPQPPPPPPPTLPFLSSDSNLSSNRKFDSKDSDGLTRLASLKHLNHSSISDSANYSDEDDEEEIKVVLKPYLPPPRRIPFSEDRVIINDDLFNTDETSGIKHLIPAIANHNSRPDQCWTPMEDLTSSDDDIEDDNDDGIHCDQQSEDDEGVIGKKDVRDLINDYNTRFTLKNQLRTLIQNNKLRTQGYP